MNQPIFRQSRCGSHQNFYSQGGNNRINSQGGINQNLNSQRGNNQNFYSQGGINQNVYSQRGNNQNFYSQGGKYQNVQSHGGYSKIHSQGGIIKKFKSNRGQGDYLQSFDENGLHPMNKVHKRVRFGEIFVQDGTDYRSNNRFYFTSLMLKSRKQKRVEEEHVFRDMKHLRFLKKEEVVDYDTENLNKLLLDFSGIDINLIQSTKFKNSEYTEKKTDILNASSSEESSYAVKNCSESDQLIEKSEKRKQVIFERIVEEDEAIPLTPTLTEPGAKFAFVKEPVEIQVDFEMVSKVPSKSFFIPLIERSELDRLNEKAVAMINEIKAIQEEKVNKEMETIIDQINHKPRSQNEESICSPVERDGLFINPYSPSRERDIDLIPEISRRHTQKERNRSGSDRLKEGEVDAITATHLNLEITDPNEEKGTIKEMKVMEEKDEPNNDAKKMEEINRFCVLLFSL